MREFEFRAWDDDVMNYQDGKSDAWLGSILTGTTYFTTMQYTGLRDKNDIKIFEGDIMEIGIGVENFNIDLKEGNIAVIKFWDGCFSAFLNNRNTENVNCLHFFCKVIGNIYENPELLEKD